VSRLTRALNDRARFSITARIVLGTVPRLGWGLVKTPQERTGMGRADHRLRAFHVSPRPVRGSHEKRPRLALAHLGRCFGIAALLTLTTAGCTGRPRPAGDHAAKPSPVTKGFVAHFDLSAPVPEGTTAGGLFPLPASRSYTGLVRAIAKAAEDTEVAGLLLSFGGNGLGWARSEELGRLLQQLRVARGKKILCHAHDLDNATLGLVARACDQIWLSPAGGVEAVGLAAQLLFVKGALDRLGIQADFIHMGRYKSAAETMTREEPSPEALESLGGVLAGIREQWLTSVGSRRVELRVAAEDGPFGPLEAKQRGLIDAVGYLDDARREAEKLAKATETRTAFGGGAGTDKPFDLGEILKLLAGVKDAAADQPHVAIVVATGAITMDSGGFLEGSSGIAARSLARTLRRLREDDSVRAVVLRIDSPGGSALASDLLWHEVRQLVAVKPVIASVGDMAASGGYYIACATSRIIAESSSIVGSIGVVGGKVALGDALSRVGVNAVTVAANPAPGAADRATWMSPFSRWDETTRARIQAQMAEVYDLFIERVATSRGLAPEAVRVNAEGRIWTGAQGKDRNLVDELGGLSRAIELAYELGNIDASRPVVVEGAADSLLESLMLDEDASAQEVEAALRRQLVSLAPWSQLPPGLLRWADAVRPLASGERVAAVSPFALMLR
jgi:protease-4